MIVLPVDMYYFGCTPEETPTYDFDTPAAIDMELLAQHIDALRRGESIQRPVYDFAEHRRTGRTVEVSASQCDLVIVEGLFALSSDLIRARCDLLVYVDERESICLKRRLLRDVEERGRDFRDALDHLDDINRGLDAHVVPSKAHAHVVGDGDTVLKAILSVRDYEFCGDTE
jgi:uridine kinase